MTEKGLPPYIVPTDILIIRKELLEDIRLELASIDQWYAFEPKKYTKINTEEGYTTINNKEFLVELDYSQLIKKIDEVLKE